MLKKFNSNTRKLNRIVSQININNLSGSGYVDNILSDYLIQSSLSASFDGRDTNGNPYQVDGNGKPILNAQSLAELSASIAYSYTSSIDTHIPTTLQSKTRSNPNPIKLVNNKNTINNFYQEILEHSARYVNKQVNEFDNNANTLTIHNVSLDYGTEGASADNFEILVFGLHIPGDYRIEEIGNNVVITLGGEYIDFDSVTINDIYVIGKLKDIPIGTESDIILLTENDEEIIL